MLRRCLAAMAIVTPLLYACGWLFRLGYLNKLGISFHSFSISALDAAGLSFYFIAFMVNGLAERIDLNMAGLAILVSVAVIVALLAEVFPLFSTVLQKTRKVARVRLYRFMFFLNLNHKTPGRIGKTGLLGYLALIAMMLPFYLFLIPYLAYAAGARNAEDALEHAGHKCRARHPPVVAMHGRLIGNAVLLECSTSRCMVVRFNAACLRPRVMIYDESLISAYSSDT